MGIPWPNSGWLHPSPGGGMGSIPGQGNKILNATRHGQRNRPRKHKTKQKARQKKKQNKNPVQWGSSGYILMPQLRFAKRENSQEVSASSQASQLDWQGRSWWRFDAPGSSLLVPSAQILRDPPNPGNLQGLTSWAGSFILMDMLYQDLGCKSGSWLLKTGSWSLSTHATNILGSSSSHIHFRKNQSSSSQIDR